MSVLCSDKTGTLTTAKMTINHDMVWCDEKFTKKDVGMYAMLASSRDKKEDAVDRTVVKYFDKIFGPAGQLKTAEFTKTGGMGFNPIYKRVVVVQSHPTKGTIKIAKGLATKVLDTKQGTPDDAEEQWTCADIDRLRPIVAAKDKELSTAGYKTLGVAVKINESPWVFVGILPMMDPPRHDTPATIANLKNAGIRVKMITGDHLNIGIETARQIGMGMNIYPGEMVRDNSNAAKQRVEDGDGFAQVLPSDKREVVEILKRDFGYVVGMTGDGVNDAPALSAAQCGVAVDDATDAAKNAAKILLTSPGLGAVYSAVVESRRIFRKLKAYITYRFAASIQIVSVLSIIIFASNCPVNPTYVILLALFNDLTMLPIAYDYQMASSLPEVPNVNYILLMSTVLGLCETAFSLMFAYGAGPSKLMKSPMSMKQCPYPQINPDKAPQNAKSIQAAIWLQMFIASEILIFSARAPSYFMLYMWPSIALTCSVLGGCLIASLMAWQAAYFGKLYIQDIVHTWVYCILCLFIIDCIKVKVLQWLDENLEVLPDEEIKAPPEEEAMDEDDAELEAMNKMLPPEEQLTTRQSAAANRMTDRAVAADERLSQLDPAAARMSLMQGRGSMAPRPSQASSILAGGEPGADRVSVAGRGVVRASGAGNMGDSGLRGSFVNTSGSLRPNVPGTLKVKR
jgi:H+-transporting ATPase